MEFGNNLNSPNQAPMAQPEMGISSAVKDLEQAIIENDGLTDSLKLSLGINGPETDVQVGGPPKSNPSLVQALRILASRVWSNNAHLRDVLGHINS